MCMYTLINHSIENDDAQNAHAYVNATFSMDVDSSNNFIVKTTPTVVIGGIDTHAVSSYFVLS